MDEALQSIIDKDVKVTPTAKQLSENDHPIFNAVVSRQNADETHAQDEEQLTDRQKEIREAMVESRDRRVSMATSGDTPVLMSKITEEYEKKFEGMSFKELMSNVYRDTSAGGGLFKSWERANTFEPDRNYDVLTDLPELTKGLPSEYHDAFMSSQSAGESANIRESILKEMQTLQATEAQGWKGTAATMLAAIADIDAPLMFMSGGTVGASKVAALAGKLQRTMKLSAKAANTTAKAAFEASNQAVLGAASGAAVGAIASSTQATMDLNDAVHMTLGATVFGYATGGALGALSKANKSVKMSVEEWAKVKDDPYLKEYAKSTSTGKAFGSSANEWAEFGKKVREKAYGNLKDSPFLQAVHKHMDGASDFDTLWNGKSDTARGLAYAVFESAAGVARGERSAAILMADNFAASSARSIPAYYSAYKEFAKENGSGLFERMWGGSVQDKFNREVALEMDRRWLGKPANDAVSPSVTKACDAMDEAMDMVREAARKSGVEGFETMERRTGYMPRVISGSKYMKAAAQFGDSAVVGLLKKSILAESGLDDEAAEIVAKAFLTRAKGKAKGMDMQVLNLTTGDSREFILETLKNNKVSDEQATHILDVLMGNVEERGKVKHGKHRVPMDLSITHEGLSMLDLIDYNVPKIYTQYMKRMAGRSALADKGITSLGKLTEIKNQILAEDAEIGTRGLSGKVTDKTPNDYLDAILGEFTGGAESEVNPFIRRAKNLTVLSTMSQLGLPQMAETGAQIATVGLWNWCKAMPDVFKGVFGKGSVRADMAHDMGWLTTELSQEHRFFRPDLQIEYMSMSTDEAAGFLNTLDKATNLGLVAQGHISLFNKAREYQTQALMFTYLDKVMTGLKHNKFSEKEINRLLDEGLDPKTLSNIRGYIEKGIVQFTPDGKITNRTNFAQWNPRDVETLRLAMRRMTHQNIQKRLPGEDHLWMRGNTASLMLQFKAFPMLAIQKQLMRNVALNDGRTYALTMYGLITAGMAYSAREWINGRQEKLSAESVMSGALKMSNITGWLPQVIDPVASMTGMDDFMFDNYSPYGAVDVSFAPALNVLGQAAMAPKALAKGIFQGDLKTEDKTSLSRMFLVGNMIGARRFMDMAFSRNN